MKRSNRLVIFVGVLLAVLAFVAVVILLNQSGPGTGTNGEKTTVTVLVAKQAIAIGDPVTPDKVKPTEVDPSAVVGTRLSDTSQVGGQPALQNVSAGSQVSKEVIAGGGSIAQSLKPGEKAIAFQVERVTGLDFLIQSGDTIDIVMSQQLNVLQPTADTVSKPASQRRFETIPGLGSAPTVKTILQNKRVLYVSQSRTVQQQQPSASATPAPGAATTTTPATIENVIVVFAGTDQDAEVIKFAQNDLSVLGSLTAVLRNTTDKAVEKTTGVTIDSLVSQYGLRIPNIVQQLSPGQ